MIEELGEGERRGGCGVGVPFFEESLQGASASRSWVVEWGVWGSGFRVECLEVRVAA
jgi:hypothetical protein